MIKQQVTAIALRLLAIWLLIQTVLNLPSVFMILAGLDEYQQQVIPSGIYIATLISVTGIGLFAVFLINKIATSVLSNKTSESEQELSNDTQKFIFQFAGLYFVVNAVAYLPRSLSFIPHTAEISTSSLLWPMGLIFQLIIGIFLIVSSNFWLRFFRTLRGRE